MLDPDYVRTGETMAQHHHLLGMTLEEYRDLCLQSVTAPVLDRLEGRTVRELEFRGRRFRMVVGAGPAVTAVLP